MRRRRRRRTPRRPKIPDLLPRIGSLFAPYRVQLGITIALVLVGAGLSVAPPLLTQQAFDRGLFPDEGRSLRWNHSVCIYPVTIKITIQRIECEIIQRNVRKIIAPGVTII